MDVEWMMGICWHGADCDYACSTRGRRPASASDWERRKKENEESAARDLERERVMFAKFDAEALSPTRPHFAEVNGNIAACKCGWSGPLPNFTVHLQEVARARAPAKAG